MVFATTDLKFWEKILRPFTKTLTINAWLAVLLNMFLMSAVMAIIDRDDVGDGANKILTRMNDMHDVMGELAKAESLASTKSERQKLEKKNTGLAKLVILH